MSKCARAMLLAAVFVLAAGSCTVVPSHPTLKSANLPPLLPVRTFIANVDFNEGYRISPDGRRVAWIAVHRLRPRIFVKSVGADDTRVLDEFSYEYRWAPDSRRLLVRRYAPPENTRIVMHDTDNPDEAPVELTPEGNVLAAVHDVIPGAASRALILHNHRDNRVFDLYSVELDSGKATLLAQNPGDVSAWMTDRSGGLRGRVRYAGERRWLELRDSDTWKEAFAWTIHETVTVLGFAADAQALWLLSNRGRDRVALLRFDIPSGNETFVHEDARVDVAHVQLGPASGEPRIASA